jgi:hypothetical protein
VVALDLCVIKLTKRFYAMTIISLALGLLLSVLNPSNGENTGSSSEAAAQQSQQQASSDYVICDTINP